MMFYLINTCKVVMLNEYEILYWTAYINKLDSLAEHGYGLAESLLFLALAAKTELNSHSILSVFESYFIVHMEGFI